VVEEGQAALDFALESDTGETIELSSPRSEPVVLSLHPKDSCGLLVEVWPQSALLTVRGGVAPRAGAAPLFVCLSSP
jgi:hypothetical protein